MKRLLAFLFCLTLAAPALAQMPQPPEVAAKSYLLLDMTSNQVLAERDADAPSDPASLTKLMTAYIVFQALREWRRGVAREHGVPAYTVLHDTSLREIASRRPQSIESLAEVSGIGATKLVRYGQAIIEVVGAGSPAGSGRLAE